MRHPWMGMLRLRLMIWPGATSPEGRFEKAYQTLSVPVSGRFADSRSAISGTPKRKAICRSVSPGKCCRGPPREG
jgi:hypothetical protein